MRFIAPLSCTALAALALAGPADARPSGAKDGKKALDRAVKATAALTNLTATSSVEACDRLFEACAPTLARTDERSGAAYRTVLSPVGADATEVVAFADTNERFRRTVGASCSTQDVVAADEDAEEALLPATLRLLKRRGGRVSRPVVGEDGSKDITTSGTVPGLGLRHAKVVTTIDADGFVTAVAIRGVASRTATKVARIAFDRSTAVTPADPEVCPPAGEPAPEPAPSDPTLTDPPPAESPAAEEPTTTATVAPAKPVKPAKGDRAEKDKGGSGKGRGRGRSAGARR